MQRIIPSTLRAVVILLFSFYSASAIAHITLEPRNPPAGAYTKLTLRVPHGCDGSATVKITVQLPEGAMLVKPQVHPGWKIQIKKVKLTKPVQLFGKDFSERVSEISWAGGMLPDENMDEFAFLVKLPGSSGEQAVFPVIQECKKGTNRWTETPPAEHSHDEGKFPAPSLILGPEATNETSHVKK